MLAERIEVFEGDVWASLQLAATREWRGRMKVEVWRDRGVVALIAGGTRGVAVNRVVGLGLGSPLTPAYLERLKTLYRDAGAERFVVQWSPYSQPASAFEWMAQMGGRAMNPTSKYIFHCDSMVAPCESSCFDIREIGVADGEVFESIVAPALGVPEGLGEGVRSTIGQPGWRYYLAFDGDRPIAGASLFVAGEQAWLGFGATRESDRRRGAQSALIRRRLADARRDGCTLASTETHASRSGLDRVSSSNLQRAGFVLLYVRQNVLFDLVPPDDKG
jgi:hypothetical protein